MSIEGKWRLCCRLAAETLPNAVAVVVLVHPLAAHDQSPAITAGSTIVSPFDREGLPDPDEAVWIVRSPETAFTATGFPQPPPQPIVSRTQMWSLPARPTIILRAPLLG